MSKFDPNTGTELLPEETTFHRLLPELLTMHEGEFAAIYQSRLVATDIDDAALAQACYQRLGDVQFSIAEIAETEITYEIPSPEIE